MALALALLLELLLLVTKAPVLSSDEAPVQDHRDDCDQARRRVLEGRHP